MACEPSPSCGGRPASAGLLLRVDRPRGCRRPLPGRNARALGRWAACRDRAVPSTPFDAPASRPPEPFRAGARLTVIANWTARPPIPRCPVVRIWRRSPRRCQASPVGTPGGVSGIRPTSATALGFLSPGFRGGDRGSAASLPSPSPFACPRLPRAARASAPPYAPALARGSPGSVRVPLTSGCTCPIASASAAANGKTWPRPSASSACRVASGVRGPISSVPAS